MYAYEMHVYEVHVGETRAYEIYACEMHTYEQLRGDCFLGGARDVGDDLTLKTRRKVRHYLMRHVYVYEFKLSIAPAPL